MSISTPKIIWIGLLVFDWQRIKVRFFSLRAFFHGKSAIFEVVQKLQNTRYATKTYFSIYTHTNLQLLIFFKFWGQRSRVKVMVAQWISFCAISRLILVRMLQNGYQNVQLKTHYKVMPTKVRSLQWPWEHPEVKGHGKKSKLSKWPTNSVRYRSWWCQ